MIQAFRANTMVLSTIIQNPVILLLATGTLIGFNFPLGKIGGEAGVSPMVWAMIISIGASVMLLPSLIAKQRLNIPNGRILRYVIISALISFVVPNLLLFSVIPHAGSGFAGLMFALSPVFTLTFAVIFRLKTPSKMGLCGIAIGLVGASIVTITRGTAPEAPAIIWIVSALLIPVALACGNIYRTIDWPTGSLPDVLAFWSHGFSVLVFISLLFITNESFPVGELALAPITTFAQMIIAGITFPIFFRLQQKGGPVLLSQIGYVAAAVGLIAATVFLGEEYSLMTWGGAGIIAIGIMVTIIAQITDTKNLKIIS